jgi:hypothetical protein
MMAWNANFFPWIYNGKACQITKTYRRLYGPGKGRKRFGNRYVIRYADATCETVPAGEFNKRAKPVECPSVDAASR